MRDPLYGIGAFVVARLETTPGFDKVLPKHTPVFSFVAIDVRDPICDEDLCLAAAELRGAMIASGRTACVMPETFSSPGAKMASVASEHAAVMVVRQYDSLSVDAKARTSISVQLA